MKKMCTVDQWIGKAFFPLLPNIYKPQSLTKNSLALNPVNNKKTQYIKAKKTINMIS